MKLVNQQKCAKGVQKYIAKGARATRLPPAQNPLRKQSINTTHLIHNYLFKRSASRGRQAL